MNKKLILAISCILLTISFSRVAYAYVLTGYKWSSSTINYYYNSSGCSSTGISTLASAASSWSGVDATLNYSSNYKVYCCEVQVPNADWDGLTTGTANNNLYTQLNLQLNTSKTNSWNNSGARQSVAVHEFGHVFGLMDNGLASDSIMNGYTWGTNSRYGTYGLTTPQNDDRFGVNYIMISRNPD